MTEPIESFRRPEVKFPNEPTVRVVESVLLYPSGLVMVKEQDHGGDIVWYPPGEAPIIKER